jgi:hypothetical protein
MFAAFMAGAIAGICMSVTTALVVLSVDTRRVQQGAGEGASR